ncbi:MAG: class D sortase [Acidobacteria bacterium]|nr:class D sortase [Acidobacteriota bacterium]
MVVRIRRTTTKPRNPFFRWTRYALLLIGITAFSYVGYAMLDAILFQHYQQRQFDSTLADLRASQPKPSRGGGVHLMPRAGSPFGRLEITAIGLKVMVLEGADDLTLRRAAGHIPGTAFPAQQGNVGIAGHRDGYFRGLEKIQRNDVIELTTLEGYYRYRVDFTQVVHPEDVQVLADSDSPVLTLVTCFPFQYVGSAPKRFIVRAHQSLE